MRRAAALLCLVTACGREEAAAPAAPVETPERQFIFEGARLEERREGQLLWVATARRTDGDLDSAVAHDIHMVKKPEAPGEPEYDILSPRADLLLDQGRATFDDVRIVDPGGGVLTAGTARYEQEKKRIYVDGPLRFVAQGMTANATRGEVATDVGTLDIQGPVVGRFDPAARGEQKPLPKRP